MSIKKTTDDTLKQFEKITGGRLTLGKLLWAIRQSENDTQVKFAKMLGVSRQFLCDVEHGRKTVSPKLAASYAKKLGYSQEQFVRLCLQEMLDKTDIKATVDIIPIRYHQKKEHQLKY